MDSRIKEVSFVHLEYNLYYRTRPVNSSKCPTLFLQGCVSSSINRSNSSTFQTKRESLRKFVMAIRYPKMADKRRNIII